MQQIIQMKITLALKQGWMKRGASADRQCPLQQLVSNVHRPFLSGLRQPMGIFSHHITLSFIPFSPILCFIVQPQPSTNLRRIPCHSTVIVVYISPTPIPKSICFGHFMFQRLPLYRIILTLGYQWRGEQVSNQIHQLVLDMAPNKGHIGPDTVKGILWNGGKHHSLFNFFFESVTNFLITF